MILIQQVVNRDSNGELLTPASCTRLPLVGRRYLSVAPFAENLRMCDYVRAEIQMDEDYGGVWRHYWSVFNVQTSAVLRAESQLSWVELRPGLLEQTLQSEVSDVYTRNRAPVGYLIEVCRRPLHCAQAIGMLALRLQMRSEVSAEH